MISKKSNLKKIKKFKLKTSYDLMIYSINKDLNQIIEEEYNFSKRGNLYEKEWDIITKLGFNPIFSNKDYKHMEGNINLGRMKKIKDFEYYFRNTNIFSKNEGGSSDITLLKNDGTWIFISCKYYKDDSKKLITDYDIQHILAQITTHNHIFKNFEIWLIVNNKEKVKKKLKLCQKTNDNLRKYIYGILDISDLKKSYLKVQRELRDLDLDKKGVINKRFCNSKEKLELRFHQDLITTQTLNKIIEKNTNFLWGWKCRAGKTFGVGGLILKYEKNFKKGNFLIITPAPTETISQFFDDLFNRFRDFNDFNVIKIKNGKKLKSIKLKKNNIIICSKQLLDDYVDEETKINSIINLNLDMIIFDENHFGGCSNLSKRIISTYSSKNTIKLFLTATFNKPLLEWDIPEENQYYWNIEDEQLCKKRNIDGLIERHGDDILDFINEDNLEEKLEIYDKMPELEIFTIQMDERYYKIKEEIKDTKYGFSMDVLLSFNNKGYSNYDKEVEKILSYISGSSTGAVRDENSIFERIRRKAVKCGSRTTLCNEKFTTQIWFLPNGIGLKIKIVSENLKKKMLNDKVLRNYEIMIINSHKKYKCIDLKGEIEKREEKAKADGKCGLILLAGKQCSLGITLPKCDIVFLMNNTYASDTIYQMMYRCMSESKDGSKKFGCVVEFNMSRLLNVLTEYKVKNKDLTIEDRLNYILVENNLINIDSDYFVGKENKNKLIKKLLEMWKSDPVNHFKKHTKKLENLILLIEYEDQKELNDQYSSSSGHKISVTTKFDEENDQELPSGKEIKKEKISEDSTEKEIIEEDISLTKDVLPFIIPLICILTIDNYQKDFIKILEIIKNNPALIEIWNSQTFIWFNKKTSIDFIMKLVSKYIKKDSVCYNIVIQFKMDLENLIDRPKELLELIDSCLKPKKIEKKKFGEVFTPMNVVKEMLDKLDLYYKKENGNSIFEEKDLKWFDPANGMGNFPIEVYYRLMDGLKEVIPDEIERKKHILENMLYMAEINIKNIFISHQIFNRENKYKLNIYHGNSLELDTEKEWGVKKFDVVLGNPPYNAPGKKASGNTIWQHFTKKSINNYLKKDGYLCFVHPPGWRKPNTKKGKYYGMFDLMTKQNQMLYLEIHNSKDGNKVFHCGTRYDIYVININKNTKMTDIKDENRKILKIDMKKFNWLPNSNINIIEKILAKVDDERCNIIYSRSNYGADKKKWMSNKKTDEFKYPCIHSTPKTGPRYKFSKINDKGHFGESKVIFGDSGINEPIIDFEGKFGMTQHAMAIGVENEEDAILLAEALKSKKMNALIKSCLYSSFAIDWNIFKDFRKDFWKEFL